MRHHSDTITLRTPCCEAEAPPPAPGFVWDDTEIERRCPECGMRWTIALKTGRYYEIERGFEAELDWWRHIEKETNR